MGRVIMMLGSMMLAASAQAEGVPQGIPQQQMDAIREFHTKQIMGSSKDLTTLQPDVVLYRKLFERRENSLDHMKKVPLDPVPMAQVFKAHDLTLGQLVKVAAAASGYDAVLHPQINQQQTVLINSHPNSLIDIAEYLTRVTDAQFTVYQEGRALVGLPKGLKQ
jgi:bisphosphoglycerate-dependent phosphoglycerate mutase